MLFHHFYPRYVLVPVPILGFASGLFPQGCPLKPSPPSRLPPPALPVTSTAAPVVTNSAERCQDVLQPAPSVTPNRTLRTAELEACLPEVPVRISTILTTVFRGFTQHVPAEGGMSPIRPRSCACTFLSV